MAREKSVSKQSMDVKVPDTSIKEKASQGTVKPHSSLPSLSYEHWAQCLDCSGWQRVHPDATKLQTARSRTRPGRPFRNSATSSDASSAFHSSQPFYCGCRIPSGKFHNAPCYFTFLPHTTPPTMELSFRKEIWEGACRAVKEPQVR